MVYFIFKIILRSLTSHRGNNRVVGGPSRDNSPYFEGGGAKLCVLQQIMENLNIEHGSKKKKKKEE